MFQRNTDDIKQDDIVKKTLKVFKNVFDIRNVIIYIITFLVSGLALKGRLMPFGLAMVAACVSSGVPVIVPLICAIVGTFLKTGVLDAVKYLVIMIVYLIFSLLFRSKVSREERNERIKTGSKLFWAYLIISTIINIKQGFMFGEFFFDCVNGGLIYVFYKLFVNGMVLISYFGVKEAYSNEEISACSILFAIAFMRFNNIIVLDMNLTTIFFIFIIIAAAWSRGKKVGLSTGLIVGLLSGLVLETKLDTICILAAIGFFAGFLKRINKFAFISIVIIANIIAHFASKGNMAEVITLREILIASIGLIFVHEGIRLTDEDIFGKFKLLATNGEKRLNPSKDEIEKDLKNGFDLYEAIFNSSKENSVEELELKERFVNDFLDNIEEVEQNMFYEEISKDGSDIPYDIYKIVKENSLIIDKDLEAILNKNNIYIFMQDSKTKEDLQEIVRIGNRTFKEIKNIAEKSKQKKDIEEAEKRRQKIKEDLDSKKETNKEEKAKAKTDEVIENVTKEEKTEKVKTTVKKLEEKGTKKLEIKKEDSLYKNDEKEVLNLLKEKDIQVEECTIEKLENKKLVIKFQKILKNSRLRDKSVSTSVADLLSKKYGVKISLFREKEEENNSYTQVYTTEDKYTIQLGSAQKFKNGTSNLVDNNMQVKLEDGRILLSIIDGKIENEEKASEVSSSILKTIKKSFSEEKDLKVIRENIDSALNQKYGLNKNPGVDIAILDLLTGNAKIWKSNCEATYIKNKKNIKKLEVEPNLFESDMLKLDEEYYSFTDGDILLMISDGVINSKESFGKDWIEEFLRNVSSNNAQKLSDLLMEEVLQNYYDIPQDDITIIVAKIVKK